MAKDHQPSKITTSTTLSWLSKNQAPVVFQNFLRCYFPALLSRVSYKFTSLNHHHNIFHGCGDSFKNAKDFAFQKIFTAEAANYQKICSNKVDNWLLKKQIRAQSYTLQSSHTALWLYEFPINLGYTKFWYLLIFSAIFVIWKKNFSRCVRFHARETPAKRNLLPRYKGFRKPLIYSFISSRATFVTVLTF